jgi:post-segregation antitoxin (ccd killing protein)
MSEALVAFKLPVSLRDQLRERSRAQDLNVSQFLRSLVRDAVQPKPQERRS